MRAFMLPVLRMFAMLSMFVVSVPALASASGLGLSPADFRARYNAAADAMNAPIMPEDPAESLAVPDKNNNGKVLSTVSIYYLNDRVSLLLNCPNKTPDLVTGAAIMGGMGDEFTFATAVDMQTAMTALLTMLTPKLTTKDRDNLLGGLGLLEGKNGDFTDGKVRRRTAAGLLFCTSASENSGLELVVFPAPQH